MSLPFWGMVFGYVGFMLFFMSMLAFGVFVAVRVERRNSGRLSEDWKPPEES